MFGRLIAPALAFSVLAMPINASASGGVWCDVEDQNVKFHIKASQARDGTGGWWGIEGSLESMGTGLPRDLATFEIKDANLTELWWDRDSVRLLVQKSGDESQNFASARFTLVAVALEEAAYKGAYLLKIVLPDGSSVTRDGSVACSAE